MKHYTLETVMKMEFSLATQPKPFPGRWPTRCYWRAAGEEYFGKPALQRIAYFRRLALRLVDAYFVEFDRNGAIYITGSGQIMQHSPLFGFYYHWQRPTTFPDHLLVPLFRKRIAGYTVLSPYSLLKREYVDDWRRYASDVLEKRLKPFTDRKVSKPATQPSSSVRAYRWEPQPGQQEQPSLITSIPNDWIRRLDANLAQADAPPEPEEE